jgi:transcriptional regulator with XRE-family HTH domain
VCRKCSASLAGPPESISGFWQRDNDRALKELPQRLKAARLERGLHLYEAAYRACLSNQQLARIESGTSGTTPERLAALANAYEITVASLLGQPSILADPLVAGCAELLPRLSPADRQTVARTVRSATRK